MVFWELIVKTSLPLGFAQGVPDREDCDIQWGEAIGEGHEQ